jgi:hypothetical protein
MAGLTRHIGPRQLKVAADCLDRLLLNEPIRGGVGESLGASPIRRCPKPRGGELTTDSAQEETGFELSLPLRWNTGSRPLRSTFGTSLFRCGSLRRGPFAVLHSPRSSKASASAKFSTAYGTVSRCVHRKSAHLTRTDRLAACLFGDGGIFGIGRPPDDHHRRGSFA